MLGRACAFHSSIDDHRFLLATVVANVLALKTFIPFDYSDPAGTSVVLAGIGFFFDYDHVLFNWIIYLVKINFKKAGFYFHNVRTTQGLSW
jgi:hypothetical protein